MGNTFFIVLVLIVAIGTVVGVAYLLDKRGKQSRPANPSFPELGPIGKALMWVARILVVLMILSIIGAFAFRSLTLVSLTGGCLGLYLIDGLIYRAYRSNGK